MGRGRRKGTIRRHRHCHCVSNEFVFEKDMFLAFAYSPILLAGSSIDPSIPIFFNLSLSCSFHPHFLNALAIGISVTSHSISYSHLSTNSK